MINHLADLAFHPKRLAESAYYIAAGDILLTEAYRCRLRTESVGGKRNMPDLVTFTPASGK